MLEPPSFSHDAIAACLAAEYGLHGVDLRFLPIGADLGTAVYRSATGGEEYFVKLRLTGFDPISAWLPRRLVEQGIPEVMAPLPAQSGRPWAETPDFTLLLYPYIEGRDGYEAALSDEQWVAFGRAMRAIHDAPLPAELAGRLPHETYTREWRDQLREYMGQIEQREYSDPVSKQLAAFLSERRERVSSLIERTERLAEALSGGQGREVLCHTDLHAGNLLLADDGRLFIVDWDAPLLAPPERDLMYPGGGQGFLGRTPEEEEAWFYLGYGNVKVDFRGLAYYRLERIIEDLAIFCEQLLGGSSEGAGSGDSDREQALRWAISNFQPGNVLDIAEETADRAEWAERRAGA